MKKHVKIRREWTFDEEEEKRLIQLQPLDTTSLELFVYEFKIIRKQIFKQNIKNMAEKNIQ
jgi:hypothetical protein